MVPIVDVAVDVSDEGSDGVEGSAADGLAGENAEPSLDHIEPGGALRSEVEMDAGVSGQPVEDGGSRVGRGVIEDDVELSAAEAAGD